MRPGKLTAVLLFAASMGTAGAASAAATVYVATFEGVFEVDTASGDRALVSGWGPDGENLVGSGPSESPGSLELGPDGKVAYGMTQSALLRIDLETGDRTVVSAAEELRDSAQADKAFGPRGGGPAEEDLFTDRPVVWDDFALDPANGRAVVLDRLGGLWTIDLDSGDRRLLGADKVGEVTQRGSEASIEAASEPGRVLLFNGSIWSLSLETGASALQHEGGTREAAGDSLNWISGCKGFAYAPQQDRAALLCNGIVSPVSLHDLPWEITANFVLGVHPLDGGRALIAGPDHGEGLAFWNDKVAAPGSAIAWDRGADRILILPDMARCSDSPLIAIDPDTGDREILSFKGQCNDRAPDIPARGSGPRLNPAAAGAIDVTPAE